MFLPSSQSPPSLPPCPRVVVVLASSSTYAYDGGDMGYSSMATMNVDESAPRDVSSFESWAYDIAGIQTSPGFALNNDDGMNLDVYACTTTDVPGGSCVLYVPENWILSSDKAMAELRTRDMDQAEKVREGEGNVARVGSEFRPSQIRQHSHVFWHSSHSSLLVRSLVSLRHVPTNARWKP